MEIKLGTAATPKAIDIGLEVTGKKLDDGVTRNDKNARGTLRIIEVDIYKK
ncbi:MAG TPA: hypothetical protein VF476_16920 [Chitinophagaceae bacterium]